MGTEPPGRDELSRSLRRLLEASGRTGKDVAATTGFSRAKVSRLLQGKLVPTEADADALLRALDASAEERQRLVDLAAELHEQRTSRVVVLRGGMATYQRRYGEIERESKHIRTFCPQMVPGLVQSPDYARVIFQSSGRPPEEVEAGIAARLERQKLLNELGDRQFTLIVTEGAVRWNLLGPEGMAEQLDQLAGRARRPGPVRIGIIPWHVQANFVTTTSFDLHDERAVITATDAGTSILTAPRDVAEYITRFDRIETLAFFGDAAGDVLAGIADDYRRLLH
ncbi:helix-turn-helix domain-containing protein (plasmid) [Pseudonocardia bannensis]|uniref:Helix-turn-helix domain-containing protein n=1 Tax=Pseudonocardia bannensis TaxID=630973 RepID=A0A848DHC7_9PSEU|nr:helix-turn-helix transcriptional regulator [Pseudonocardia bannensis]NMH92082.1 helix-turn-helix domain-containing protein [Pseudonocardia bannensis]